jgi:hypothetical protein
LPVPDGTIGGMKKGRSTELCVYCELRPGTTADHVLARAFLGVAHRGNMPKVPACLPCNNRKAELERYLSAVLPFGGLHADASRLLSEDVPPRLANDLKLTRDLYAGRSFETVAGSDGAPQVGMAMPLDGQKLIDLFAMIARGLIYWHWRHHLDPGYTTTATVMRAPGQQVWERMLAHRNVTDHFGWAVGHDALRYEGWRDVTNLNVTGWQFQLYGGMVMSDGLGTASMILCSSVRQSALAAAR